MNRVWLFDLDNTLHRADGGVFALIDRAMTLYLAQHLRLSPSEASDLRLRYWREEGATVTGVRKHLPEIDVADFLRASHPLAEIRQCLRAEADLPATLDALAGRKAIFSNGPSFYVRSVLRALAIDSRFERVFACDDIDFDCKPHARAFLRVCAMWSVLPRQCVLVDDNPDNLRTGKDLGMTTVWLCGQERDLPFVDLRACDLRELAEKGHSIAP